MVIMFARGASSVPFGRSRDHHGGVQSYHFRPNSKILLVAV